MTGLHTLSAFRPFHTPLHDRFIYTISFKPYTTQCEEPDLGFRGLPGEIWVAGDDVAPFELYRLADADAPRGHNVFAFLQRLHFEL